MPDPIAIDPELFRAFERAGWEEAGKADDYHSGWGPVTRRTVNALLDAADVNRGDRVLDLASGPGYVAAAAGQRGAVAVGVDIAANMVTLASRLHPGIDFRQAEAEDLPFPDGSFDAVVGNFVINHLGEPEKAVLEVCRALRPGGRLAFTLWDRPDQARFIGVMLDAVAAVRAPTPADLPPGPPIFRFADDTEFRWLLLTAGLTRVRVRRLTFVHRFASSDELWQCLVQASVRLGALVLRQPPWIQQRIRHEFERNVQAHADGGAIDLPVSVKLGSAQKVERM